MRVALYILAGVLVLLALGTAFGMVGFHYPKVIQNEPLQNPQKVTRIEGSNLILQSGAMVRIEDMDSFGMSNRLAQSQFEIELDGGSNGGPVTVWARQNGWICGTPWAQPIRIPVFLDTVYRNRKLIIATGNYVRPRAQP